LADGSRTYAVEIRSYALKPGTRDAFHHDRHFHVDRAATR
jgi:hypothetical protein